MRRLELTDEERRKPYAHFYERESADIPSSVLDNIQDKTYDVKDALPFAQRNDLLSSGYLPMETGHCILADGSHFVAVRTPLPNLTGEMINWWFDWHPHDPLRYKIWFPETHFDIKFERNKELDPMELPHWHTIHYPIEDIGLGREEVIIRFVPPVEFGFDTSRFEESGVETIICGYVGSVERRMTEHTRMCHLVRRTDDGLEMRSRFWMGGNAEFKPFLGSGLLEKVVNTKFARNRLMSPKTGYHMAMHCAQEYNNLAQILPELYETYGKT